MQPVCPVSNPATVRRRVLARHPATRWESERSLFAHGRGRLVWIQCRKSVQRRAAMVRAGRTAVGILAKACPSRRPCGDSVELKTQDFPVQPRMRCSAHANVNHRRARDSRTRLLTADESRRTVAAPRDGTTMSTAQAELSVRKSTGASLSERVSLGGWPVTGTPSAGRSRGRSVLSRRSRARRPRSKISAATARADQGIRLGRHTRRL